MFQNATKRHAYLNSFSVVQQSAKYGINQFSHLSLKEFRGEQRSYLIFKLGWSAYLIDDWAVSAQSLFAWVFFYPDRTLNYICQSTDLYPATVQRAPRFSGLKAKGLPAKFDWRDKAVVAPVQDQQAVRITQMDGYMSVTNERKKNNSTKCLSTVLSH